MLKACFSWVKLAGVVPDLELVLLLISLASVEFKDSENCPLGCPMRQTPCLPVRWSFPWSFTLGLHHKCPLVVQNPQVKLWGSSLDRTPIIGDPQALASEPALDGWAPQFYLVTHTKRHHRIKASAQNQKHCHSAPLFTSRFAVETLSRGRREVP